MKKIINLSVIALTLFGCKSENHSPEIKNHINPPVTDESPTENTDNLDDKNVVKNDEFYLLGCGFTIKLLEWKDSSKIQVFYKDENKMGNGVIIDPYPNNKEYRIFMRNHPNHIERWCVIRHEFEQNKIIYTLLTKKADKDFNRSHILMQKEINYLIEE